MPKDNRRFSAKLRLSFVWLMVFAVLLFNLLVMLSGYLWLRQGWKQYESRATITSQNIARLLEQSIADSIERTELALHTVNDEMSRQLASGFVDGKSINAFIARQHARIPDLDAIRVSDESGLVRYGVNLGNGEPVSIAERAYFTTLRDNPHAGTVLSPPYLGKISRKWIVSVASRYNDRDGAFAGVSVGVIDLDYFALLFSSLNVGAQGSITLRDADMNIVTRFPHVEARADLGGEDRTCPVFATLRHTRPYKGTFTCVSAIDHIERIVSYQKVGKWPLYIQVGLSSDEVFHEWRATLSSSLATMICVWLLSMTTAYFACRNWRARKKFDLEMERKRQKFRALAEMSTDWFWEQDRMFRFARVSKDLDKKYGISGEDFEGKTRWEVALDADDEKWEAHRVALNAHMPFRDFEYCVRDRDGEKRYILVSGEPLFDDAGQFSGYQGVGRDITERKRYEERIQQMAQYDSLTGLPNRALFHDRLLGEIKRARRDGTEFALLYFDLDRFKPVNDEYGHAAGDQLLQMVAFRVQALVRESDTIGRLGGDEFAMLIPRVNCRKDAEEVAARIIRQISEPFQLSSVEKAVMIGVSIGVAVFPHDADTPECLMKYADTAMYRAKQTRNCYRFYDAMMKEGG